MLTNRYFSIFVLMVFLVGIGIVHAQSENVNVAGTWDITIEFTSGVGHHQVILTQQDSTLTGTYKGDHLQGDLTRSWREIQYRETPPGSVSGNTVDFTGHLKCDAFGISYHYHGTVEGDMMKGTVDMGEWWEAPFTAVRVKK